MAKADVNHSIQGSWLGTYYYSGHADQPCGFEAVFVESAGRLSGNILDHGKLGEADVSGRFNYPAVLFQKRYRNTSAEPIRYQGNMSEDGNTISGFWQLPTGLTGTWTAMRFDMEEPLEEEFSSFKDKVESLEEEKVQTSPLPGRH